MGSFEFLPHTADIALRVSGRTVEDLFAAAAAGMFTALFEAPGGREEVSETVGLTAPDAESLLVNWLNELLYIGASRKLVLVRAAVTLDGTAALRAATGWRKRGPGDEQLREIKAATYHQLAVRRSTAGYETTIVFDV